MASHCEVPGKYNYYRHNPIIKFVGPSDRNQTKSSMNNIECYKCHKYGHISRNCNYKMEPNMNENLDDENKNLWKGKQLHDEQVQDEQEKQ